MPREPNVLWQSSLLVPLMAVHACYACARMLNTDSEKVNCRCCYHVFCTKCANRRCLLREYGYVHPQRVCLVCHTLLTVFPRILSEVQAGHGGMLLMPNVRVWVTDAKSCVNGAQSSSSPSGRPGTVPAPPRGIDAAVLVSAMSVASATSKEKTALPLSLGMPLTLLNFRPINPDTVIAIGDAAQLPLRCISAVERDSARVRLSLPNGYIDLTFATVEGMGDDNHRHRDSLCLDAPHHPDEQQQQYSMGPPGVPQDDYTTSLGPTPDPTLKGDVSVLGVTGGESSLMPPKSPSRMPEAFSSSQWSASHRETSSLYGAERRPRGGRYEDDASSKGSILAWLYSLITRVPTNRGREPTVTMDIDAATAFEAGLNELLPAVKSHMHLRSTAHQMDAAVSDSVLRHRTVRDNNGPKGT